MELLEILNRAIQLFYLVCTYIFPLKTVMLLSRVISKASMTHSVEKSLVALSSNSALQAGKPISLEMLGNMLTISNVTW